MRVSSWVPGFMSEIMGEKHNDIIKNSKRESIHSKEQKQANTKIKVIGAASLGKGAADRRLHSKRHKKKKSGVAHQMAGG